MAHGEAPKNGYEPKTYAGLSPRQPLPPRRLGDYFLLWEKLRESHPKYKLLAELVVWMLTVAFVYFEGESIPDLHRGAAFLLAWFGWIFPVYRAFQWFRLRDVPK